MNSCCCAFAFENHVAHGAVVTPERGRRGIARQPRLQRSMCADWWSEALAAMPLLSTHLNFEGRINLQFQNDHARSGQTLQKGRSVEFLVAQVDRELQVRGMARAEPHLAGDFVQLLSGGLLALMLEPANPGGAESMPAHQALVPIEGARLSDALEIYFERSEQLPDVDPSCRNRRPAWRFPAAAVAVAGTGRCRCGMGAPANAGVHADSAGTHRGRCPHPVAPALPLRGYTRVCAAPGDCEMPLRPGQHRAPAVVAGPRRGRGRSLRSKVALP